MTNASRTQSGTIAIAAGWIVTGDADEPWIENGHILVRDGIIESVGADRPGGEADRVIDAGSMIVAPGFVNAHTHLCMTLGRTLGTDGTLLEWLTGAQLPLMSAFAPEDYALACKLGAVENLKAGNTTISEVFFSNRLDDGADELAMSAIADVGLRGTLYRCSNDLPFAPGFVEGLDDIERRSRDLIERWAGHDRMRVGVGPLVPWSATREYWAQTKQFIDDGVGAHLHTAETADYNDLVREATGLSNVGLLDDVGVLGPATVLNHCIHVSDDDIALIAASGSPVIHDPTSNMFLASGVAPISAFRAAGVPLGLACDGPACNNTQDMFEVMKDAALLQKVITTDPRALTARDVFTMATATGAVATGLDGVAGRLKPGHAADLIFIDTEAPHLTPIHDPLAAVVYSARAADVHSVMIDGEMVLENGTVPGLDEAELLAHARERARELARRADL